LAVARLWQGRESRHAPVPTGGGERSGALPDVAFSMTAQALLLCYAVWEREEDDQAYAAWHSEAIAALDKLAVGHYVGESVS
jgi:hypothetical protein